MKVYRWVILCRLYHLVEVEYKKGIDRLHSVAYIAAQEAFPYRSQDSSFREHGMQFPPKRFQAYFQLWPFISHSESSQQGRGAFRDTLLLKLDDSNCPEAEATLHKSAAFLSLVKRRNGGVYGSGDEQCLDELPQVK